MIKTGNETEEESNEMQEGKAMQNNNIKHKTKQEKSRIDKWTSIELRKQN